MSQQLASRVKVETTNQPGPSGQRRAPSGVRAVVMIAVAVVAVVMIAVVAPVMIAVVVAAADVVTIEVRETTAAKRR